MKPIIAAVALVVALAPPAAGREHRCRGERATIVGSTGDDKLRGTPGRDVIVALDGYDVVHGGPGDDLICLGPSEGLAHRHGEEGHGDEGDDVVLGAGGRDALYGGKGDDYLEAGLGRQNVVVGGPGDDRVIGGPGDDLLGGAEGPASGRSWVGRGYTWAHVPGEAGDDRITGGPGDDQLIAGKGDDTMVGGRGIDRLAYWSWDRGAYSADLETGRARGVGRDSFTGIEDLHAWTRGDVLLRGDERPNVLLGSPIREDGRGRLYGEGADDLLVVHSASIPRSDVDLYGGHGNDALIGSCDLDDARADALYAGPGADEIVLGCGLRDVRAGPGNDTIVGMEAGRESLATHDGGPGFDMLVFDTAWGGIDADLTAGTLTMHFEDGSVGRTHPLVSIDGVIGTDGYDDVIVGDDGPNVLMGGISQLDEVDDDDRIEGRGGDDEIFGDDGNDRLDGGEGVDTIDGGDDVDTCTGGESVTACELT